LATQAKGMNGSGQFGIESVTISREDLIRSYHDEGLVCEVSVPYEISDSTIEDFLSAGAELLAELYPQEMGLDKSGEEGAE